MTSFPPSGAQTEPQLDARSSIVEAAGRLLREGGIAAVTTRSVARAADVPAPTIFRIFGDKDGLMDAVAEHVMATHVSAKERDAAVEGADPVQDLRDAWHRHLDFGLANPDLYVLLSTPGRHTGSAATLAGIDVLRVRVGRLAAAGLLALPEEHVVDLVHAAGTGAVLALLQQPASNRDTLLADTMLDAVLRIAVPSTPGPPTSDLVALATTFRAAVPGLAALSRAERDLLGEWIDRSISHHREP